MIIDSGIVTGSLQVSGSFSVQGNTNLNGGLNVIGGITGSISGSSATAISASYAATASSVTLLYQNVYVTGALSVDGDILITNIGKFYGTASQAINAPSYLLTASYNTDSASVSTRVTNLESWSSSLDATYATDAQLNAATASLSSSLAVSIAQNTATGSTLTSASASFASQLNNIVGVSGSYATTGSNTFVGNQSITGDVNITGSITALSASFTYLSAVYETSSIIFASGSNIFGDNASDIQTLYGTVDIKNGPVLVTGSLTVSSNIYGNLIGTASYIEFAQTASLALTAQNANTASYVSNAQTASYVANAVSASRASSALNADTASYVSFAQTASLALTAQNATTASYVNFAQTASYVENAQTASFVQQAQNAYTASYVSFAQTASLALTADNADTASYVNLAQTASYVANAISASRASSALNADTASYVNYAQSASYVANAQTASYVLQAENAYTASYVQNAQSASYVQNAQTASYVNYAQTASFVQQAQNAYTASYVELALSASRAISALNADTASYVVSAASSSNAKNADTASYAPNYMTMLNPTYSGVLTFGTMSFTPAGAVAQFENSLNNYNQLLLQNTNNANVASSDFIVNNDVSTDTDFYGDFGINSSGFTGVGSFNLPNATYLYAAGGDLVLGTVTGETIRFATSASVTTDILTLTGSDAIIAAATQISGSLNVTGSTILSGSLNVTGSQTITGSLDVAGNITTTGSLTAAGAIQVSGSLNVTGSTILSGSVNVTGSQTITGSLDIAGNTTMTGSLTAAGAIQISGSLNTTGSTVLSGSLNVTGSQTITGSLDIVGAVTMTGSLTTAGAAQISGSLNVTGSTILSGSLQVTGSTIMSGSLVLSGSIKVQDSSADLTIVGNGFGQMSLISNAGALVLTPGLYGVQINGTYPDLTVNGNVTSTGINSKLTGSLLGTASYALNSELLGNLDSTAFAKTGSNAFTGTQYISDTTNATSFTSTAALYTDGGLRVTKDAYVSGTIFVNNLTVYGTSSVQYTTSSQADFGTNIITVNTATPVVRFGGYAVYDSGSTGTGLSGSLLWDSQEDRWLYTTPSSSAEGYNSAILISGPKNTGALGNESGLTIGKIAVAVGDDHIGDSIMNQDGSFVYVTGSLSATTLTGSLDGSNLVAGSVANAKLTNSTITIAGTSTSLGGSISGATILVGTGVFSGSAQITGLTNANLSGTAGITNANLANSTITIAGTSTSLGGSITAATILSGTGVFSGSAQIPATSITNAQLANSSVTVTAGSGLSGGGAVSLGSSVTLTNAGVTSNVAGTGIGVSGATGAVTISNTGVTSAVAGTGVSVSAGTGAVTISIGQAVATSSNVQFNSLGVGTAGSGTAGEIRATADITAYYSSDERLKENIAPIENPIEKLMAINGVTFDWKEGFDEFHSHKGADTGVIAQQIEAIGLPDTVTTRENGYKAVKYEKLNALLIEGFKAQQIELNALKLEMQELKAKLK